MIVIKFVDELWNNTWLRNLDDITIDQVHKEIDDWRFVAGEYEDATECAHSASESFLSETTGYRVESSFAMIAGIYDEQVKYIFEINLTSESVTTYVREGERLLRLRIMDLWTNERSELTEKELWAEFYEGQPA